MVKGYEYINKLFIINTLNDLKSDPKEKVQNIFTKITCNVVVNF